MDLTNLRRCTGIIILLLSLALPTVAAIENNTTAMTPSSNTPLYTIFGFDVDALHIILFFVFLMAVIIKPRDKIHKLFNKFKEWKSKKKDNRNRDISLSSAFVEIAQLCGIDGISNQDIDVISSEEIVEFTNKIIGKIETSKSTIEQSKEQLENAEETKYLKDIASFIGLKPYSGTTPEDISTKIKLWIDNIKIYNNKLDNSMNKLISAVYSISPPKNNEEYIRCIEAITKLCKENKDRHRKQDDISKKYENLLTYLKEERSKSTEFDENKYEYILNDLIYFIENRDNSITIYNGIKKLNGTIKSVCDENGKLLVQFKRLKSITEELKKTDTGKIGDNISETRGILNDIKSDADENTVRNLDAIGNYLNNLSHKSENIGNTNIDLINYVVKEQVSGIKNILLLIQSGKYKSTEPSVTQNDVEHTIKNAKVELRKLESLITSSNYGSTCNHEIPKHYEKLISDIIKRSEEKFSNCEFREANICINDAMNVIKYTKCLYEDIRLCALLETIRK